MQIEMTIKGLMVDPITNMPIIILRDNDGQKVLPIWVGIFEANAIALQIENVSTPRPMTHDLLRNVIHDLKAIGAEDRGLRSAGEHLLRADLPVARTATRVAIDARPSDAIALALRTRAPIFVEDTVIDNAKTVDFVAGEGRRRSPAQVAGEPRPGRPRQVQDVVSAARAAALLEIPSTPRHRPALPPDDRCDRQPEGRRRQDHDRHQPRRGAGAARQAHPAHRSRSAGQQHDVVSRHAAGVAERLRRHCRPGGARWRT